MAFSASSPSAAEEDDDVDEQEADEDEREVDEELLQVPLGLWVHLDLRRAPDRGLGHVLHPLHGDGTTTGLWTGLWTVDSGWSGRKERFELTDDQIRCQNVRSLFTVLGSSFLLRCDWPPGSGSRSVIGRRC